MHTRHGILFLIIGICSLLLGVSVHVFIDFSHFGEPAASRLLGRVVSLDATHLVVTVGSGGESRYTLDPKAMIRKTPRGGGIWQLGTPYDLAKGSLVSIVFNTQTHLVETIDLLPLPIIN